MSSDVSLTGTQRAALIDLRENATLSGRTQRRLSSGRKINSVIDDSVNYFKAKALTDNARDFQNLRAEMAQAIKHLEVTLEVISSLEKILSQIKGILEAARSQGKAERTLATQAIINLGKQFNNLVQDASYGGANLINDIKGGREIQFGVREDSKMTLPGLDLIKATAKVNRTFDNSEMFDKDKKFKITALFQKFDTANAAFIRTGGVKGLSDIDEKTSIGVEIIDHGVKQIDGAIKRLRGHAQSLGSNVAILQERERFTDQYVSLSTVGAEKYTLADLNEEGANLVALQTRQQLGIQALAVAGQQQRAILTLLQ